jgi:hypothetical protein
VLTAVQKRIAQYKNALRKQYSGALYQSPSPPASLREQMTRESLESVVDRFRTLSKMQEKIGLDLREAKKTRTFFRKRGDTVRKAQAKLMRLLQRSTGSRRKAGKFTVAIMKAWNPTIAPANKETARVSSLRKRQK